MVVAACGTFGEESPSPGSTGTTDPEAGAADAPSSGSDASAADAPSGIDAASCNAVAPWSLDFSGALPVDYALDATGATAGVTSGRFVASLSIPEAGGTFKGRFVRDLDVPTGVDSLELRFTMFAGAAPPMTNVEVGCSLYLRPDPGNPSLDRRFILRSSPGDMTYQWNGVSPTLLGPHLPPAAARELVLTLNAAPSGTTFTGTLTSNGDAHSADLDLGAVAKAVRLECGIVFAAAGATATDGGTRSYSVSVDDVSLSICARP